MIKNLIFDFGDVFINLDKGATLRRLSVDRFQNIPEEVTILVQEYEKGTVSTNNFLEKVSLFLPEITQKQFIDAWNAIILDFPDHRMEFLQQLVKEDNYRLILLSNTNELHINAVVKRMGEKRYHTFKRCFAQFYLSHEVHLRKPEPEIFKMVLRENSIKAHETFFIDDTKEHIMAAAALGIKTWHLKVGEEDIIQLKSRI